MTTPAPPSRGSSADDRRSSVRRVLERRRTPTAGGHNGSAERRVAERRREVRRADDVAALACPSCANPLEYDAAASWKLPSSYAVDAGWCRRCNRLFVRNRVTGDYDDVTP